jgi:hypothetical protein
MEPIVAAISQGKSILLVGQDVVPLAREALVKCGKKCRDACAISDDIEFQGKGPFILVDIDQFAKDPRLKTVFKEQFIATTSDSTFTLPGCVKIRPKIVSKPCKIYAKEEKESRFHVARNVAVNLPMEDEPFSVLKRKMKDLANADVTKTEGIFLDATKGMNKTFIKPWVIK